ncbi:peptidyl-tRNA hydrolase [Archaeoglobales archaeon]|nr:MAG: peptidyl-tRNA hydrolase [Archaeoglobales archaeon]HDN74299.1 peptidyl-tRNA hydrolase [Archaeoglobus sp.]
MTAMYKQVIVVRTDLNLSKGKLAVQVAHAAVIGLLKTSDKVRESWLKEGQKKIVLQVENLEKLLEINNKAKKENLPTGIVIDSGLTEIPPGTITAVVIGPELSERIDRITGNLPLLR